MEIEIETYVHLFHILIVGSLFLYVGIKKLLYLTQCILYY